MGYVPSVPNAFLLIFITMLCWGSWANTMKKCGDWRFETLCLDYTFGSVLWIFILALVLGSITHDTWQPMQFIHNTLHSNPTAIMYAFFAGAVWAIGNILIVAAIAITGISVAFPLGIGIALVLGTFLAYITNPTATHKPLFLFIGLLAITAAVITNGMAYNIKESKNKKNAYFKRGLGITILCGILLSLFSFPFNFAFRLGLNSYSGAVYFILGAFLATIIFIPIFMRKPLIPHQHKIGISEYFRARPSWHIWAVLGGIIWSTGMVFNLVVASQPKFSVAIAYTLAQCACMIGALWGIFVWKEFRGASSHAYLYLGIMFFLFIAGILSLANAIG